MNKFFLAAFSLAFYLTVPTIFAYESPQDFRQIEWGADVKDLKNMEVADPGSGMSMYTRKNDAMHIGEADIISLYYGFYNDRFYSVYITFRNPDNFSKIKDALVQEYGTPAESDQDAHKYSWGAKDEVSISLDYKERHGLGNVIYLFKPISEQQEKDNSL